jgi:hypothetical protein
MKRVLFLAIISQLVLAPPCWAETYENWLARCKSYKDVAEWLNTNFHCDRNGVRREGPPGRNNAKSFQVRSAEETFRCRTGLSLEAAVFAKHSLNRINPEYRAEIIHLVAERSSVHYVCGLHLGGRLFVMDYASPHEKMIGTHGPFRTLGEYVEKFYLKYHPLQPRLQSYDLGRPSPTTLKQKQLPPKTPQVPICTAP